MGGTLLRAFNAAIPDPIRPMVWKGLRRIARELQPEPSYNGDGLRVVGRSVTWLHDPSFQKAYAAGMNSGHHIMRARGSTDDIHIEWRVHLCCWAAQHALHLDGDFVECGVNTGITSLAVCNFLDFNKTGRTFYLFDTYDGIPESQMSATERPNRVAENASYYEDCYDVAKRNFAPFPKAQLVRGTVPETLATVKIDRVAYLHLDMNIAHPERAAIEHFWPKLAPSAVVMLDDYGHSGYEEQRQTMDDFAAKVGVRIATLPTGQGMIIKPAR